MAGSGSEGAILDFIQRFILRDLEVSCILPRGHSGDRTRLVATAGPSTPVVARLTVGIVVRAIVAEMSFGSELRWTKRKLVLGWLLRYSGRTMKDTPAIDPIRFTQQLCEIESTTYLRGTGGGFSGGVSARSGMGCGEDAGAAAGRRVQGRGRGGMCMRGQRVERRTWFFRRTWIRCRRIFRFARMTSLSYGRGVCDAKGIIAAQIAAAEALRAAGLPVGDAVCVGRGAGFGGGEGGE